MTDTICIGVPYFLGERVAGRSAADEIRASGLAAAIGAPWIDVAPDFAAHPDPIVAVNRALAEIIAAHRARAPLIFAEDCVSALGAMKGLAGHDPVVLWLDAHGDFNTPATTPSGFLGGMPLAMLVGRGDMRLMQGLDLAPIPEEDVVITDARNLDPEEAAALRASAVTHLRDFDALMAFLLTGRPLYVHVDIDVVDPAEMPAVGYPAPGGPSLNQVAATLTRVARDGRVAGISFSLWDAGLAADDRPLQGTLTLVRAFLDGMEG